MSTERGRTYEFRVSAKNNIDYGERAQATVKTPDGGMFKCWKKITTQGFKAFFLLFFKVICLSSVNRLIARYFFQNYYSRILSEVIKVVQYNSCFMHNK